MTVGDPGSVIAMASFMTKKKKYKFQVDINIEELLEVPFVSAVLFAKLRLLDGGNFQDTSSRVEVRDHAVRWGSKFSFPCKMLANASTGVLERCILRISIRRESKGGRSFDKLGFVDLNLAEYAGSGETCKKALLEGYDNRHTRQDNSMLRFSIKMNMLSGDVLFKVPSPSLKHKQPAVITHTPDENPTDPSGDFSGGSLAGSIASGSSGFGSLPKKRTPLLQSDLVIGHTLIETTNGNQVPPIMAVDNCVESLLSTLPSEGASIPTCSDLPDQSQQSTMSMAEPGGHSRNSSNTSQMSRASGYSSIHSSTHNTHSRQSSSGDSGHIRGISHRKLLLESATSSNPIGGKLAPLTVSPSCDDDLPTSVPPVMAMTPTSTTATFMLGTTSTVNPLQPVVDCNSSNITQQTPRRPSITTNPSSSSLVLSETGSLDRAKAAMERRKKVTAAPMEQDVVTTSGRVEGTRVNPDDLIAELLNNTNLEPTDDSAETSGLQLFIAKDGTAALGNHEVKSQMQTGVQHFKQVVMGNTKR